MTWTRLPDNYVARRWDLSAEACRLDLAALVESVRLDWEGRIPKARLRHLVPRYRPAASQELVDRGFWREETDHFLLVDDVLRDQLPAAEVERQREHNRIRQARWREKQRTNRTIGEGHEPQTSRVTGHASTNGVTSRHPGPSRPEGHGEDGLSDVPAGDVTSERRQGGKAGPRLAAVGTRAPGYPFGTYEA